MLKCLFMPIEAPLFSNYYLYLCGDIYDSPMIKKSIFTILILSLLLLSQTASGQKLRASLSHYSTDNGLTSNTIADIIQDGYGYLWIATWNGLSRFDGYQFYNYRTGNASMIPGLHNRIRSLVMLITFLLFSRLLELFVLLVRGYVGALHRLTTSPIIRLLLTLFL